MNIPDSILKYRHNQTIQDEIEAMEKQIEELQDKVKQHRGRFKFKCPECKKFSMLKSTDAVQHHYYVEPYGCTGGDYWTQSGVTWTCPKCETPLKPDYGERDAWQGISYYFKSKTDKHER